MTITHSDDSPGIAAPAGIRNPDLFFSSLRDFSWLSGVVPGASDMDVACERNGHVLLFEGKAWQEGVSIPWGQHKLLLALSSKPDQTVVIVGEDPDSSALYVMRYSTKKRVQYRKNHVGQAAAWWGPECFEETDLDGLRAKVAAWWVHATNNPLDMTGAHS